MVQATTPSSVHSSAMTVAAQYHQGGRAGGRVMSMLISA